MFEQAWVAYYKYDTAPLGQEFDGVETVEKLFEYFSFDPQQERDLRKLALKRIEHLLSFAPLA